MAKKNKSNIFILTISGKDKVGIIAKLSTAMTRVNVTKGAEFNGSLRRALASAITKKLVVNGASAQRFKLTDAGKLSMKPKKKKVVKKKKTTKKKKKVTKKKSKKVTKKKSKKKTTKKKKPASKKKKVSKKKPASKKKVSKKKKTSKKKRSSRKK